jgi:quercetin dioxygenase-like cupin family protein
MIRDRMEDSRGQSVATGWLGRHRLSEVVNRLRREPAWRSNGRNGATLIKSPEMSVVVTVLKPPCVLSGQRHHGPITVHVLQGRVRLGASGETHELSAGEILASDLGLDHAVRPLEEAVVLVSLGGPYTL